MLEGQQEMSIKSVRWSGGIGSFPVAMRSKSLQGMDVIYECAGYAIVRVQR
jgi:hypothetical protein